MGWFRYQGHGAPRNWTVTGEFDTFLQCQLRIYGADHETGDEAPADEQLNWPSGFVRLPDGTIFMSECRSARIRVIAPDRKSFHFITSAAMKHAAIVVVAKAGTAGKRGHWKA